MNGRIWWAATGLAGLLLAESTQAGVVPIDGTGPDGRTYSQLAQDWWTWAIAIPKPISPMYDHNGRAAYVNQKGHVFYLAPTLDTDATRDITIGADQSLFFPILTSLFINGTGESYTEAEMRGFLNDFIGTTSLLYASVDGEQVPNPWMYRASTPAGGFAVNVPEDDIFGLDETGPIGPPVVGDGFWLLVEPLSVGQHTVRFDAGTGDPADGFTLTSNVTYHINVVAVPEPVIGGALLGASLLLLRRRSR